MAVEAAVVVEAIAMAPMVLRRPLPLALGFLSPFCFFALPAPGLLLPSASKSFVCRLSMVSPSSSSLSSAPASLLVISASLS